MPAIATHQLPKNLQYQYAPGSSIKDMDILDGSHESIETLLESGIYGDGGSLEGYIPVPRILNPSGDSIQITLPHHIMVSIREHAARACISHQVFLTEFITEHIRAESHIK